MFPTNYQHRLTETFTNVKILTLKNLLERMKKRMKIGRTYKNIGHQKIHLCIHLKFVKV